MTGYRMSPPQGAGYLQQSLSSIQNSHTESKEAMPQSGTQPQEASLQYCLSSIASGTHRAAEQAATLKRDWRVEKGQKYIRKA